MFKKSYLMLILSILFFACSHMFSASGGGSSDIIEGYFDYAQLAMEKWHTPGMAIGIVDKSGGALFRGFGVKNLKTKEKVDENTIFQIGSTTKAFTSFLMAKLIEDGKINWNDRVTDYFPEFEMSDKWITEHFLIKDLMAQHSGLNFYTGDMAAIMGYGREDFFKGMKFLKPQVEFRSEFTYVNCIFLAAAKVIENVTGKSYEQNLKDMVFDKIGMNASNADGNVFLNNSDAAAMYSVLSYSDDDSGHKFSLYKLDPESSYFDWPYVYAPAGGINSSVSDMSKWLLMHLNSGEYNGKEIISKDSIEYLYHPQTIARYDIERAVFYSQGWVVDNYKGETLIWHSGSTSGCTAYVGFMPEYEIGIVILANLGGTGLPELLGEDFFTTLVSGKKSESAINSYIDPEPEDISRKYFHSCNPEYIGLYHNDFYGTVDFSCDGSECKLTVGPKKAVLKCVPQSENEFVLTWLENGLPYLGSLKFEKDANGKTTMVYEIAEHEGAGIFTKIE